MNFAVVITTVNPVNDVTTAWSRICEENDGLLIVVGDSKGPKEYSLPCCQFIPAYAPIPGLQSNTFDVTPYKSYARKNLGYLYAMLRKVPTIYETDDDNYPENWAVRDADIRVSDVSGSGWFNTYEYFGTKDSWPRGYPLTQITTTRRVSIGPAKIRKCPVQQGLIAGDSDVDAIYRLTRNHHLEFKSDVHIAIQGPWAPFNSQSTWWFKEAWPLLYLPSTCSMRATDILRGYVASRCLREDGFPVAYHSPSEVRQVRNDHSLLHDFRQEIDLYLHAESIANGLDRLVLRPGNVLDNMVVCYEFLAQRNLVSEVEVSRLWAWIADYKSLC